MKHINLKSIFATFLLLVGVCQVSWGTDYYYRGNQNEWGATLMTPSKDGYYAYYQAKSYSNNNNKNNYFKIALSTTGEDYNGTYLQSGFNSTDITNMGGDWDGNNCGIYHTSDYYVLVYYPNTSINTKNTPIICASTFLPNNGGSSSCTVSEAPAEVIEGTHVMFYIESYGDADKNIALGNSSKKFVSATKVKNNGQAYVKIDKDLLSTYCYITNSPGNLNWAGVQNEYIPDAKGGEYFVGNDEKSKKDAKTATTTTSLNSNTLSISTTANSATGVCNDLQLYVLYYIDGTFAGVTYNDEEADYCSIKASTSAISSTYDISSLSAGEHTLLTILTDGNIYYIADTDKFTTGSTPTTYTVTFDVQGHGTAPAAQTVNSGKQATEPADPTAEGYTFGGWYTEKECTTTYDFNTAVTANITLYAKWTETKKIYVQGRFRVRESEGGKFLYTGEKYDDWNNNSESIQFIYDSEKKLYKLPTYCTTWELSKSDNKDGAVFHFKIGDEHWGATDNTNPQPGYTSDKGKEIQATQNNFKFTYACTGGKNVVLWLDLGNKKFWYEAEEIPPLYALDGDDDFGKWNAPTYLTPDANYITATCTITCESRGLKRFNLRQVVSGDDLTSIGAIKCAQGTIMRRGICEEIPFLKEGNSADANPAIVVDTKGAYIFTYAYATNKLTVKYPDKVVKPQAYVLYGDFYDKGWKEYKGSWSNDTTTGTWILENIPEGAHMFMLKAADGNLYFNAAAGAGSIQRENTSVHVDNEYSSEYRENITLNADEAGTYTFKLDFNKRLITVTYPNSDKIKVKYRLVYAEQKPDGKYEKYHPSTPYINAVAEDATAARRDTVSLHIRDSVPVYDYNSLNQTEKILHYDYNPNTLSVHLQKWTGTEWKEISTVSLSGEQRKGKVGVYNFVVVQNPNAKEEKQKVYIDPNIEAYKGNYYIRTNVAPGGWNNYKKSENQITYSDYAAQHKHFDHYWCKWINPSEPVGYYVRDGMANLKFTIANDYSNCVSDTCRDELDNRKFTINGRLGSSANVRWMWHSKTNAADRAYIAGGDNCLFFVPKSEGITCKDKDGKPTNETCAFTDRQNWTYKIDVTTPPNTKFAITKKPHNDAGDTRYCILGCETEEGETLILGTGIDTYDMRVVYDFKSDHLIYAWIPKDPTTIDNPIVLGSTVVCMRKDDGRATQVTFGKDGALNDVHEALGVLSLSKKYFWTDWTENNKWEREWYWISFPFDVCVSDIFSSFVFGQHYIIQDYDGASRAEKGCWADSPSYWRTLTRSDTLKAGKGYVLNIGHNEVGNTGSNPYLVDDKITELNIYFPSTGVTKITGAIKSVEVKKHTCNIKESDRDIYDSNWNLIGVPTWVNIADMPNGQGPEQPAYTDVDNIITNGDKTVGFYYHFNTGTEEGKPGNTWTPRNVKENGSNNLVFQNMRSYLIQWAGTINWSNKSWDETPSTQGLQARRAAEAKSEEYTLRLELSRGETALDQTFVRLQEDGDVTADYDMNYDMTKIINPGANLYSLIGTNLIKAGANVLPLPAENTTVYVPVGVVADKDGTYTYRFSMPDGTDGMLVSLADHETGMTYNLTTGYCDVPLTKGTYEQRFVLEIQPKKGVTTGCNESTTDDGTLRKVLIDGNLYIQRGDALYDAAGRAL